MRKRPGFRRRPLIEIAGSPAAQAAVKGAHEPLNRMSKKNKHLMIPGDVGESDGVPLEDNAALRCGRREGFHYRRAAGLWNMQHVGFLPCCHSP